MPRVQLTFDGDPRGALGAARQVSTSLGQVRGAATGTTTAEKKLEGATDATTRAQHRQTAATAQGRREMESFARGALAGSGALGRFTRGAAFLTTGFLGGAGLTAALRGAFGEMEAGERASIQTGAVLKSTGAVAGITARGIDQLAQSQMRLSGVDDELIKQGANWLLTFRQVRNERGKGNDIFNQATRATLNLAVAQADLNNTEVDLASASTLVGKALNDPLRGMNALQRVGVTFNTQQRAQIKAFIEQGDIMGAQKVILRELNAEVGGTAKAYGQTLTGSISRARETVRNMAGSLLTGLSPAIKDGSDRLAEWADKQQRTGELQRQFNTVVHDGGEVVKGAVSVFRTVAPVVQEIVDGVGGWKNATELLIGLKVASALAGWSGAFTKLIGVGTVGAETGAVGAAGAVARLRRNLLGLNGLVVKYVIVQQILKQFIPGLGADLSEGTTPDTTVTGKYHGQTVQGIKGTGGGDVIERLNAGQKLSAKDLDVLNWLGYQTTPLKAAAGAMQLPSKFTATHDTLGADWAGRAPGPDAVDLMAKPGVALKAPEDGELTRISGHDPSDPAGSASHGAWGRSFYYVGDSGTVYYGTHLSDVAPLGRYRKGDVIAIIGAYPGGASHVHWAIVGSDQEAVAEAHFASTQVSTLAQPSPTAAAAATPTKFTPHNPDEIKPPPKKAKKAKKVDPAALTADLRLRIAEAAGSPSLLDDVTTAGEAVDFLTAKLNKTTNKGVKAGLVDAINGYQAAIKDAEDKMKDIAAKALKAARAASGRVAQAGGIGRAFEAGKATIQDAFRLDLLPAAEEAKLRRQTAKLSTLLAAAKRDGKITPNELKSIQASWTAMQRGIGDAADAITTQLQRTAATRWAGVTAAIGRAIAEAWQVTTRDFGRETDRGLKEISDRASTEIEAMSRRFQSHMDAFNVATAAGLKALEVLQTPTESLLAERAAAKATSDRQQRIDDAKKVLDEAVAAEAKAQTDSAAVRSRGAESLADYNARVKAAQDSLVKATEDRVAAERDLAAASYDDETAALQARADAERKAADAKTEADQADYQAERDRLAQALQDQETVREDARRAEADAEALAYQDRRDAQLQALQDRHDDQLAALNADLEQWGEWLANKQRTYQQFLDWLAGKPIAADAVPAAAVAALGPVAAAAIEPATYLDTHPSDAARPSISWGGLRWGPTDRAAFAAWLSSHGSSLATWKRNHPDAAAIVGYQHGGRVPGAYVGVQDSVMVRATPGERFVTAEQQRWLENVAGGRGRAAAPAKIVLEIDGRELAHVLVDDITTAQGRIISYRSTRA